MVAPPRAKPLDEAVVTTNVGKKRLLLTAAGGIGMFFVALAGVGLWEFGKRKVECVDEVIFGFGIAVVGTLPTIQSRKRGSHDHRMLGWSGYIDSFRTILLRGEVNPKAQVVLVTSAEAGEGKTSLASHLAISLARSGRKTLLLDCDTRNPTAHKLFNLSRSPGWSQVLAAELPCEEAALPSGVPELWVLPAGEYRAETHNRLGTEYSAKVFGQLKQRFDLIVIDSCPILPVADTLQLAPCTDGVVFSILRRRSRMPKVSAALHRLRMLGVPILGAVVSGTDEDVYSSGYYSTLVNADR